MTKIERIKEKIVVKILYSIKNVDVLKRVAVTAITFSKNIDPKIKLGDIKTEVKSDENN